MIAFQTKCGCSGFSSFNPSLSASFHFLERKGRATQRAESFFIRNEGGKKSSLHFLPVATDLHATHQVQYHPYWLPQALLMAIFILAPTVIIITFSINMATQPEASCQCLQPQQYLSPYSQVYLSTNIPQESGDFALFLHMQLLLSSLNCLYVNPQVFTFILTILFPIPLPEGVGKWLCDT